jgi:hypothetical protein
MCVCQNNIVLVLRSNLSLFIAIVHVSIVVITSIDPLDSISDEALKMNSIDKTRYFS